MKRMKPDIGHVVRVRRARDWWSAWKGCGIIIAKRGIEVLVMLPDSQRAWVRRDSLDVVSDSQACKVEDNSGIIVSRK